jgi:hypothetical protein
MLPRVATWLRIWVVVPIIFASGCITGGPDNPSFPLTEDQGRAVLHQMKREPRRLERPLVVVSGYRDSHAPDLQRIFRRCTGDERVVAVSLGSPDSMEICRQKIIEAVDAAYPTVDSRWTNEVDVVGISLGGLAARYAAVPDDAGGRRLRLARLFTVSSPHRGAVLAKNYVGDAQHLWRDLRPGSAFLMELANCDASARYTLYPYARLHDGIVSEYNTALAGQIPMWIPCAPFADGHDDIWNDPRILADITRRLRGEPPFATLPRAPLPP